MKPHSFKSIFNVCVLIILVTVSFALPSSTTKASAPFTNLLAFTCGAVSFSTMTNFAVGPNPRSVTVGDFNGDGKKDLATANDGGDNASVLLGNGLGSFGAATNFGAGTWPDSVTVGDFNGDSKQDLAVANYNSGDVSVLLGNGAGSFGAATNLGTGSSGPYSVAVGDFNGDTKQDLVVANSNSLVVSVLLGNGDGTFGAATTFNAGSGPKFVAVGDFNGDGKQDMAVANNNGVSVLLGNGAGSFGAATNFSAGSFPSSVVVGDFNGDGKQDLAVANNSSNYISVLLGNGDGTFGAATNFGFGAGSSRSIAVGDFNGDGKQDLAVANQGGNNVAVLLGDGAGSFGAATSFGTGIDPFSITVGDFNGDSKPDLAVANATSNTVSVLLNNCDNVSPTVSSHSMQASYTGTGPTSFTVTFSEDVSNPAGNASTDDVTNPNNYKIINKGSNGTVDTASCASVVGGDDTLIIPSGVTYVPNTAIVTIGAVLPTGSYRLLVCGTTSIVSLTNNPLNGGSDFNFDFTVGAVAATRNGNKTTASSLPKTGFAPNKITFLPAQPADLAYANLGDLWLEIPSLNVKSTIVGVPQNADKTWDVTWLGNDTGWLNGTAFPTWTGNSVLTAHVTNASGLEGPFAALKSLKYGDQVIVHFGGVKYVYEVRVTKLARPYTTNFTFESMQDASYLTLVTCSGYNPLNETYLFRRVVRAVLVSTVSE